MFEVAEHATPDILVIGSAAQQLIAVNFFDVYASGGSAAANPKKANMSIAVDVEGWLVLLHKTELAALCRRRQQKT